MTSVKGFFRDRKGVNINISNPVDLKLKENMPKGSVNTFLLQDLFFSLLPSLPPNLFSLNLLFSCYFQ